MSTYLPTIFGENLMDVFDDFDRNFFRGWGNVDRELYGKHARHMMKTDVKEVENGYEVDIDLPGFKKDEITLELKDGYLTISAQKAIEKDNEKHGRMLRQERAQEFVREIREQMGELNFLDNRLEMRFTDTGHYSADGRDEAEFFLAVNPGEPLKPLASIASGGELSRIMLAVKTVLADREDTPTLIFDEIDAGISGITADRVGEKLSLIAKNRQVICITHLPQIAAAADSHFLIEKNADSGSVRTQIRKLDEEGAVMELARILGGSKITDQIIGSAREMKELAARDR